mmetsp:Transcript_66947/g.174180  ORF Transcript_66947/g.174180 Transcript_66947/m.174180 type:complete len:404 (+) Transcript_66947:89-1300(+)
MSPGRRRTAAAAARAAALVALLAGVAEGCHDGCPDWDVTGLLQAHVLVHRSDGPEASAGLQRDSASEPRAGAGPGANRSDAALVEEYKEKVLRLKEVISVYRRAKEQMRAAREMAEQARSRLHEEADRLALQEEAQRQEAVASAGELIDGTPLKGIPAGPLLDVLVDLPAAAADAHLARTAEDAAADVREWVTKFLDSTNRETDNFVAAAATLPDAALLNLTSRFLDDTSHRLKMLQKHTLLVALRVKKAMPAAMTEALSPVIAMLTEELPALRVDASRGAQASCHRVSQIMGNVTSYSARLNRLSDAMNNATAQTIQSLGGLSLNSSDALNSSGAAVLVHDLVSMAELETNGLQEATRNVIKKAGPIITDRVHCTFSSGSRAGSRLGLLGAASCLAAGLLAS